MKNYVLLFIFLFSFSASFSQSDSVLMKMNIFQFCKAVGIPEDYNKRYEAIILPLCDAGKILFAANTNPYADKNNPTRLIGGRPMSCYWYVGNEIQNEILKRNILANRHLIINGKLSNQNAKKWKVVK